MSKLAISCIPKRKEKDYFSKCIKRSEGTFESSWINECNSEPSMYSCPQGDIIINDKEYVLPHKIHLHGYYTRRSDAIFDFEEKLQKYEKLKKIYSHEKHQRKLVESDVEMLHKEVERLKMEVNIHEMKKHDKNAIDIRAGSMIRSRSAIESISQKCTKRVEELSIPNSKSMANKCTKETITTQKKTNILASVYLPPYSPLMLKHLFELDKTETDFVLEDDG